MIIIPRYFFPQIDINIAGKEKIHVTVILFNNECCVHLMKLLAQSVSLFHIEY
jgi:hypothetical protein